MSSIIVNLNEGVLFLKPIDKKMFVGNVAELKKACENVNWQDVTSVVVDMENIDFIDSTGVGFLIGIHKKAGRMDSPLLLIHMRSSTRLVIELLNVSATLRIS